MAGPGRADWLHAAASHGHKCENTWPRFSDGVVLVQAAVSGQDPSLSRPISPAG